MQELATYQIDHFLDVTKLKNNALLLSLCDDQMCEKCECAATNFSFGCRYGQEYLKRLAEGRIKPRKLKIINNPNGYNGKYKKKEQTSTHKVA